MEKRIDTVGKTLTYGSETSGLISGFVFSEDGVGCAVGSAEATRWLQAGHADAADFVWLHFNGAIDATAHWLEAHCTLPDTFFAALMDGEQSTRIEYADESLVAVLNDVIYDFLSKESSQVATLWLSVDRRMLITCRRVPLRSIDRLRQAVKSGETFQSPLALFKHLLNDQGDVLVDIIRRTARKVDGIEDQLLSGRLHIKRTHLGTLRRDLVRLQRLLAPEPSALFRLLNRPPDWMGEDEVTELRQSAEEFSLILREMSTMQERIKLLQEEIAASIAERTGRAVFVLTAVTVLALPVNMIASLFGMNVGGVPYGQDPEGFWIVLAFTATLVVLAAWLVFRDATD